MKGLVCVTCALFAPEAIPNNRKKITNLGNLVNKPLSSYSHLLGKDGLLTEHLQKEYHLTTQVMADNFLYSINSNTDIKMTVNAQHWQNVQDSRNRLVPIIKTNILCAQLGIALRGHRDDGKVDIQRPLAKEDGNSKAL